MDYQEGKVYTIRSHLTEKYYIGSTKQLLCKRMMGHKSNFKKYNENGPYKTYVSSYEILKLGDAYIELLELYPCETKELLKKREGELIRQHRANVVNISIAGRNQKEWGQDNKERVKERRTKYRNENKEKIKKYFQDNSEVLKEKRKAKTEQEKLNKGPKNKRTQEQIDASKRRKYELNRIRLTLRTPEQVETARLRHNELQRISRSK